MANTQPSHGVGKDPAAGSAGQPHDMRPEQTDQSTQSAPSLSRSSDDGSDDGRFSVAEEQNFDQQSDRARHVGQMPEDEELGLAGLKPSEAVARSAGKGSENRASKGLERSMDRAVPKSDDAG